MARQVRASLQFYFFLVRVRSTAVEIFLVKAAYFMFSARSQTFGVCGSLFEAERLKRQYEQKKNSKFQSVLATVKQNLQLIKIDQTELKMLEENNKQQKIQIQQQEEKFTALNNKIEESKKKILALRDEASSQEIVEIKHNVNYVTII